MAQSNSNKTNKTENTTDVNEGSKQEVITVETKDLENTTDVDVGEKQEVTIVETVGLENTAKVAKWHEVIEQVERLTKTNKTKLQISMVLGNIDGTGTNHNLANGQLIGIHRDAGRPRVVWTDGTIEFLD